MSIAIPPIQMIRNRLEKLSQTQLKQLAKDSGVPFGTLMHIRIGTTKNPGTETVRAFWPLISLYDDGAESGLADAAAKAS